MTTLLLVFVASALGGSIHTMTSFATFIGNRRMEPSWVWWYVLRIHIGVGLALLFYAAISAGLLSGVNSESGDVRPNPIGIIAISGLVGMFSKQATDKLKEVFDTLFRSNGDDQRKDKLTHEEDVAQRRAAKKKADAQKSGGAHDTASDDDEVPGAPV